MNQNLSARLDDLTTRVERLEQARPSPQPHGGNQVAQPPQQTRPEASPPASVTETVRPSGQNGQGTRAALNPPAKRPIMAAKDISFLEPEDDSTRLYIQRAKRRYLRMSHYLYNAFRS